MKENHSSNQHSFFKEVTGHVVETGLWTGAGAAVGFAVGSAPGAIVGAHIGHIAGSTLHVGTLDGNKNNTSPSSKK